MTDHTPKTAFNHDDAKNAYEKLKARFAQIKGLEYAYNILGKDMETAMPEKGGADRAHELSSIMNSMHALMVDVKVGEWLTLAESDTSWMESDDKRNLSLMRRLWIHETAMPEDVAREQARLDSEGSLLHIAHYKSGDWGKMKDWYTHSFTVMKAVGEAKMDKLGFSTPYEALVDSFSPGISVASVEQQFDALDTELRSLIKEVTDKQAKEDSPLPLNGPFPREQQMELNNRMAKTVGFDFSRGRLDMITGHPSSGGSPDDSRITTRCNEDDFLPSLFGTVHESGHSMYTQGQPAEYRYQPVGNDLGMAIHESQSMVIEYQACMTDEFIAFLSEQAQEVFDKKGDPSLSADNLRKIIFQAQPSFIRVEADPLTYSMHVMLRFGIEKDIINGKMSMEDMPQAWNDGMKERLGIVSPDFSKGCMQDVHWPVGAIGYFPAYTLGAMIAAQLFAAATRDCPNIKPEIRKGNFKPLRQWLLDNVHSKGSLLPAEEMLKQATGEGLNAKYYLDYLKKSYLGVDAGAQKDPRPSKKSNRGQSPF